MFSLLHRLAIRRFLADVRSVDARLVKFSQTELAKFRSAVGLALAFLIANSENEYQLEFEVAFKAMYEGDAVLKPEIERLGPYLMRLNRLQYEAATSKSSLNKLISAGLPIWMMSIRSTFTPELVLPVREIWRRLESVDVGDYQNVVDRLERVFHGSPLSDKFLQIRALQAPSIYG